MPIVCMLMAAVMFGCISASEALPLAQDHVLFVTTGAMLWSIGKMVTEIVPQAWASPAWRLFRRTLPFHPVLAGVLLGAKCPDLVPESVGSGRVAAALYFGASGVLAAYGHDIWRTWRKHRSVAGALVALLLLGAVSGCSVQHARPVSSVGSTGACIRSFRPTLDAWEARFGRAPKACAFLDREYSVQLVSSSKMPCREEMPCGRASDTNSIVVGCTQQPNREIFLLNGRTNVDYVNTSAHEWIHAIEQCVHGDMDRTHSRAGLWASGGAQSVEIQAQAGSNIGTCL